jgi:putative ABC transport system permease protein
MDVDKDQPIHSVMTMEERISSTGPISQARFRTLLLAFFALSALAFAGTGIYGVVSYSVSRRTSEIGIRMALGAQQKDILKMILGESMFYTLFGVIIGLASAFALTRLLSSLLFGISPTDTTIFIGAATLVALVSLSAIYVPARKAMNVDPLVALRRE